MDKGNSQPLINLLTFQEVAFWPVSYTHLTLPTKA